MIANSQKDTLFMCCVIVADLFFQALMLGALDSTFTFDRLNPVELQLTSLAFVCAYFISIFFYQPLAHQRETRAELIAARVFRTSALQMVLFFLVMVYMGLSFSLGFALLAWVVEFVLLFASRLLCRQAFKVMRRVGRDNRTVVLVGSSTGVAELFRGMNSDPTTGYRLAGYFNDEECADFSGELPYLGKVDDVVAYLDTHHVDQLYCDLPSERSEDICYIINYCENHLLRFYSVPNVRNYGYRTMMLEFVSGVPVLSMREEPLREPINRFEKRCFDILVSALFLCTLFIPIYLIVGLIIKLSSPGPVFFRQKRNGLNGREFYCYKFRSMHVNKDADLVQATRNDTRKFRFGAFMRRTNIDELPQFINVLLGHMSVVGPRPHMLRHTEEYSALINRYMVRHFAKPGITGWAQVTGSRGETSELWQMEDRIRKDIWYLENWTFWLDIRIIYMTVRNILFRSDENAY